MEIKNFLGEKEVRKITALPGVTINRTEEAKDELTVQGTNLENASLTCNFSFKKSLFLVKNPFLYIYNFYRRFDPTMCESQKQRY